MTRDFELKKSGLDACGRSFWEINGLHWDDITEYPELGTTEIWRFINDSGVSHPMHMHLDFFQILDRDGFTRDGMGNIVPDGTPQAPPLEESGWKDTAMVGPNEILRVIARFEDYTGLYAYHCHILEHEDHEMMRQFQTIQCGNSVVETTEECDDGNTTSGDGCYSTCDFEDERSLVGTAQGGSVEVTVDGVLVTVPTTAGQTAEQVAADVADAITNDPTLAATGVSGVAIGNRIVSNGTIEILTLNDPGLAEALVPVLPGPALWGLAAMLGIAGLTALRRGRVAATARIGL